MTQTQELDKREEDGNVRCSIQPIFTSSFIIFKNLNLNNSKILNELETISYISTDIENELSSDLSVSIKLLEEINEGNKIKEVFKICLDHAIKSVWKYDVDHQIINSWATRTSPGRESKWHTHKNFWLSAVYYPCNENNFKIRFSSERHDLGSFEIPSPERNIYNCNSYEYQIEGGDLILFNAALRHKIVKNTTTNIRYSLAMNILPKGKIGDYDGTLVL